MVKVQLKSAVGIGLAQGARNQTARHIVSKVRFVDCAHNATIGQLSKFSHILAATSDNHLIRACLLACLLSSKFINTYA